MRNLLILLFITSSFIHADQIKFFGRCGNQDYNIDENIRNYDLINCRNNQLYTLKTGNRDYLYRCEIITYGEPNSNNREEWFVAFNESGKAVKWQQITNGSVSIPRNDFYALFGLLIAMFLMYLVINFVKKEEY